MCGLTGYVVLSNSYVQEETYNVIEKIMRSTVASIRSRGVDSIGASYVNCDTPLHPHKLTTQKYCIASGSDYKKKLHTPLADILFSPLKHNSLCCHFLARGIPTTEFGGSLNLSPDEIQPFLADQYSIAHNGTISNDKELTKGYPRLMDASISRYPHDIDSYAILRVALDNKDNFVGDWGTAVTHQLHGSYSFSLIDLNRWRVLLSKTYLGLYVAVVKVLSNLTHCDTILIYASTEQALLSAIQNMEQSTVEGIYLEISRIVPLPNHSSLEISFSLNIHRSEELRLHSANGILSQLLRKVVLDTSKFKDNNKCAVVLSGGLDSTVCATLAAKKYSEVHLLHFNYGCKAESSENLAVQNIHQYLVNQNPNCQIVLKFIDASWLKQLGASSLTTDSPIELSEKGAELATEWVPARNLAMIGIIASYCDAHDIGTMMLGLNREESAAFSDNSSEFFESLSTPLRLGTKQGVNLICPLGDMMKHHIVNLGAQIEAPLHLTWSCYSSGVSGKQCGQDGPCLNTKRAFKMAGIDNPIEYEV